MALQQQISAQQGQDLAQLQGATGQALIQYGAIPDFSSLSALGLSPQAIQMLEQSVTPQVSQLAQQNTGSGLSTEAQLQQQQQQAMLGLRNNLAARGALSSGDDAYRTNLQDQAYALAQQHALNSLLSAIGGYQGTYLQNQQTEQGQLNQGLQTAEQNQINLLPYYTTSQPSVTNPSLPALSHSQVSAMHTLPHPSHLGAVLHFHGSPAPLAAIDGALHG